MNSPPVRYSVDDEDFDINVGSRLVIKLNGLEQKDVISFDAEAGKLTRFEGCLDDEFSDRIVVMRGRGTFSIEKVYGHITVEWKENA